MTHANTPRAVIAVPLHEFMRARRSEILELCHELLADADGDELGAYAGDFFDEIVRALRRDSGMRDSSPLPESSDAAARLGTERQRAGMAITQLPRIFSAISQALGHVGERHELTISAEEYKRLNSCFDTGIATAIERFWQGARHSEVRLINERFGFMAHDLRNALGNANLAFKLVRANGLDLNGQTGEVMARNLVRMEALIAQYLASAGLEAGVAPTMQPVHVASLLRDLEAAALPDRGVVLSVELDERLFIAADEMLLTSTVNNLLHNGIKFSPPGSTVHLSARALGGMVAIEVSDQCGGISGDVERLFEPYVKTREGNRTGTGLGLSIAKRATEAMGGKLTVANDPGHGCSFTAFFPILLR